VVRISPITVLDGVPVASARKKKPGSRKGAVSVRKSGAASPSDAASALKGDPDSSRRPRREALIKDILDSYHVTDGCPPLAQHWGGHDLAKTAWLKGFAERIADNLYESLKVWRTLKEKCDTSWIIELLYLLTFRGKVRAVQDQDAYHALVAEIEKIISRYDKLRDDIVALVRYPRFSSPMAYMGRDLLAELQRLEQSRKRLETLRNANKKWGSYKRTARDWYLFLLAREIINSTDSLQTKQLARLIEVARSAHNERADVTNEAALKKRIQRWATFMNAKMIGGQMLFPLGKNAIPSAPGQPAGRADTKIPFW
jgi:hypothetical protein